MRYGSLFERLIANSDGPPEDQLETGCWPWTGSLTNSNYASMTVRVPGRPKPRKLYGHRVMEQIMRDAEAQRAADDAEPDPWKLGPTVTAPLLHANDETVEHFCCYRRCINPDHWELVTRAENTARMRARLTKPSN